jgi:hypothetical protein
MAVGRASMDKTERQETVFGCEGHVVLGMCAPMVKPAIRGF